MSQKRPSSSSTPSRGFRRPSPPRYEEDYDDILDEEEMEDQSCPLFGWSKYFPDQPYSPSEHNEILEEVNALRQHLDKHLQNNDNLWRPLKHGSLTTSVTLDYGILRQNLPKGLMENLHNQPSKTLTCLALALVQFIYEDDDLNRSLNHWITKGKMNVRIYRFEPLTHLKNLKSHLIGKFVSVRGTVIRVGNIKPLITNMKFVCNRCAESTMCYFIDGRYGAPAQCGTSHCRSRSFEPDRSSGLTVDWQKIKLQEMDDDQKGTGRIPRCIEVELLGDLVDSCVPGDVVTVTGEVKVINVEEAKGRSSSDKSKGVFLIYVAANSIENNKQLETGKVDLMRFTMRDMNMIQEIGAEKNLFRAVVNSICPSIYGHEIVKAGLALALFGGVQKFAATVNNKVSVRGDPHVLVVGDPGLGKSQMLQAVSNLAPRGVFVCGSYSSTTGLTVTMLREKGSGDYALEAGALVLADQGCCCIDEFDKMNCEHQALLEAMEQQSISIAKAGIVCTLPARTSVLAAANPVGGHYNRAKTVCENLKMSAALLSRFDLIFILLDKPDAQKDQILSDHVMALHSSRGGGQKPLFNSRNCRAGPDRKDVSQDQPLSEWLSVDPKKFEPIPPHLLRKFIGYARKHVSPRLSPAAASKLEEFYMTLREKHRSIDSTPVTTRQLESLVRLAEARAKIELRELVTEEDAIDVIEIMKESLFETFEDEYGFVDFRRTSGMSKGKQAQTFVAALTRMMERDSNPLFTMQQLQQVATEINLQVANFRDFVESLNLQGFLLKRGGNTYCLYT